jgi:hypothetical protein
VRHDGTGAEVLVNDQALSGSAPIILLHLPKTAGSSLREILRREYGAGGIFEVNGYEIDRSMHEFAELPRRRRRRIRAFLAQVPYGLHQMLEGPSQYITLLRHPLDRIVSHYSYVLRDPTSRLHAEVVERGLDLEGYVTESRLASLINNGQTSALGTETFPDRTEATCSTLETAKANLEEGCAVFGLTERFDESIMLMKNAFGWRPPLYKRKKVSPQRPEVTERVSTMILEMNQLDLELYEHASACFERIVADQGPAFLDEVESFRQENSSLNEDDSSARRSRRRRR